MGTMTAIVWRRTGDGEYTPFVDGEPTFPKVFRRDEVTPGYWGRWKAGRNGYFTLKRHAITYAENTIRERISS